MVSEKRINKTEFVSRISQRSGLSVHTVNRVYLALTQELLAALRANEAVVLMGLGRFYRQEHRGHKVYFGDTDVVDYAVMKFSASRHMNRRLAEEATTSNDPGDDLITDTAD